MDLGKRPRGKEQSKKVYEKPRLQVIKLEAEEVLAIGCKLSAGGSAPLGVTCTINKCASAGS